MTTSQIRKTIKLLTNNHRDSITGEINYTSLAEETAQTLNFYEGNDIPELIFELALEAA